MAAFGTKNVHSDSGVAFIENSSLRFYYSLYLAYSARLVSFAKFPSVSKKLAKSLDVNVAIFLNITINLFASIFMEIEVRP